MFLQPFEITPYPTLSPNITLMEEESHSFSSGSIVLCQIFKRKKKDNIKISQVATEHLLLYFYIPFAALALHFVLYLIGVAVLLDSCSN